VSERELTDEEAFALDAGTSRRPRPAPTEELTDEQAFALDRGPSPYLARGHRDGDATVGNLSRYAREARDRGVPMDRIDRTLREEANRRGYQEQDQVLILGSPPVDDDGLAARAAFEGLSPRTMYARGTRPKPVGSPQNPIDLSWASRAGVLEESVRQDVPDGAWYRDHTGAVVQNLPGVTERILSALTSGTAQPVAGSLIGAGDALNEESPYTPGRAGTIPVPDVANLIGRALTALGLNPDDALREEGLESAGLAQDLSRRAHVGLPQHVTLDNIGDDPAGVLANTSLSAVESLPVMAAAIATRNPTVGAGLTGVGAGTSQYATDRLAGDTPDVAAADALATAAIEALTEKLPLELLMKGPGGTPIRDFGKAVLAETGQEAVAGSGQYAATEAIHGRPVEGAKALQAAIDSAAAGMVLASGVKAPSTANELLNPSVEPLLAQRNVPAIQNLVKTLVEKPRARPEHLATTNLDQVVQAVQGAANAGPAATPVPAEPSTPPAAVQAPTEPVEDELAPRPPAPVTVEPGTTRAQLIREYQAAQTEETRATAAARIAAYDQQEKARVQAEAEEGPREEGAQGVQAQLEEPAEQPGAEAPLGAVGGSTAAIQSPIGQVAVAAVSRVTDAPKLQVHNTPEELPAHIQPLAAPSEGQDDAAEAFYDERNDTIHIISGSIADEKRAAWVIEHEIGHATLRSSVRRQKTGIARAMRQAQQNPTVSAVVQAMAGQRREQGPLAVEEAIVELLTAHTTGGWDHIQERYGVTVPQAVRASADTALGRLWETIKQVLSRVAGRKFTDVDLRRMLERASAERSVAQRANSGRDATDATASRATMFEAAGGKFKRNIFNERELIVGGALVELGRMPGGGENDVFLSSIRTLDPGKGLASAALNEITRLADEHGVTMRLIAAPFGRDGGLNKKALEAWYARAGFEKKGQYMVRTPAEAAAPVASRKPLTPSRTTSALLRDLTPAEQTKITDKVAEKVVEVMKAMPGHKEVGAVTLAGKAKRGWYAESTKTISAVFGADAPRFVGLLAALSPQTSVEANLSNALSTWKNWRAAGSPALPELSTAVDTPGVADAIAHRKKVPGGYINLTAQEAIELLAEKGVSEAAYRVGRQQLEIMGRSVQGGGTVASVLPAWQGNAHRVLNHPEANEKMLSGPKVDSFMRNLLGDMIEVTNDAWMANFAAVNQKIFSGRLSKTDAGKGPGYLAMSALTRRTARYLTQLTGETWTPAEVQETVWSWSKTLYEMADSANEFRTAEELVADGEITDELISSTPDFGTLFTQPDYARILQEAGYGDQLESIRRARADVARPAGKESGAGSEAAAAAPEAAKHLRNAARRLDALRKARSDAERGAQDVTDDEPIPFSRKAPVDVYGPKAGTDLTGLPSPISIPGRGPVAFHGFAPAQEIARRFAAKHGATPPTSYAQVDEERARRIAAAYDEMEHNPNDPEVKRAYAAMIDETLEQYRAMVNTGLVVEFIEGEDPYAATPRLAILDVVENNHLWVFPTTEGFGSTDLDVSDNPLLAKTPVTFAGKPTVANDVFRAVHDYFGHIANGNGFRADGEENAWREHASMYSPLARRAMTSETRGQNSWVNYGPRGEHNRTASSNDTTYADQKTGLLPKWVSEDGATDIVASRGRPRPFDSKTFGQVIIPVAKQAQASLGRRANDAVEAFQRGVFSTGNALEQPDIREEVEAAFAPVRELLRKTFGDTVKLYRAQNIQTAGGHRPLLSWSFSNERRTAGSGEFMPRKYGKRSEEEINDIVEKLRTRGHVTVGGNRYVRSKKWPEAGDDYFMIYDRQGEVVTDMVGLKSLRDSLQWDNDFADEQNAAIKKRMYAAEVPVEQIKWIMANALSTEAVVERDPAAEDDTVIASRGWHAKKQQPDAIAVDAIHYSNSPSLKQIDPTYSGTGRIGAAQRRRFGPGRYGLQGGTSARAYFFVRDGSELPGTEGVIVGAHPYQVRLTNLYDQDADPRGFAKQHGSNIDALEEEISDAGFDGLYSTKIGDGSKGAVAIVFDIGKKKIPVEPVDSDVAAQRAYHGTPHNVDKFSLQKIGTGEGAQAFGWGLYFAGRKELAKWYRDRLSNAYGLSIDEVREYFTPGRRVPSYGGGTDEVVAFHEPNGAGGEWGWSVDVREVLPARVGDTDPDSPYSKERLGRLRNHSTIPEVREYEKVVGPRKSRGNVYAVDIPEHDELLDYDRPISGMKNQHRAVMRAFLAAGYEVDVDRKNQKIKIYEPEPFGQRGPLAIANAEAGEVAIEGNIQEGEDVAAAFLRIVVGKPMRPRPTGKDIYTKLEEVVRSPRRASEMLLDYGGIKGIRFLDAQSRNKNDDHHWNYVVWDEEAISDPEVVASRPGVTARANARANQQGVYTQVAAQGVQQGTPSLVAGRLVGMRDGIDAAREKLQDRMLRLLRAQEATGSPVTDMLDAYTLENLMHGRAADQLKLADRDFVLKLKNAMLRTGVSVEQLQDVLLALHAPERNAKIATINQAFPDGGSGITTADARGVLNGTVVGPYSGKLLSPDTITKARSLAGIVQAMRARTIELLEQSQQITPQLARTLRATYQHYVPLRGQDIDDAFPDLIGSGRGLSHGRPNIKRALGRTSLAKNILGEAIGDLQRAIVQSEKARVTQAFLRFAIANPMPDLFTVSPVDLEWKFSEATGEAYLGVRSEREDADRSIIVPLNGKPVRIRFEDPRLRDAMMNLSINDMSGFVKIFGAINRWRSAVLTRFNPGFAPVNLVRDAIFGMTAVSAEQGPAIAAQTLANYLPAVNALLRDSINPSGNANAATKSWADWAREYAETGAKTGLAMADQPQELQRQLSVAATSLMRLAAQGRPIRASVEAIKRAATPLVHAIENVNDATENALRLAVYVALREKGQSRQQAATYAKNVTINFNRKGHWGSVINSLYLFYNASLQGTHAVLRVAKHPGVQALLAGFAGLQFLLAMAMQGDDDEDGITDWDAIPDYVKRTSLVIPLNSITGGRRDYFAVPMPYGFNLSPYLGGRAAQWYSQGSRPTDSSVALDALKATSEAFSPVPVDEGYRSLFGDQIGFLLELAANKDDLGRPIAADSGFEQYPVPMALKGRADTPRAYQSAAQLLAKVGGGDLERRVAPVGYLDVAPEQIESVVGYFTGGLGNIANKGSRWWDQLDAGNLQEPMDVIGAAPIASRFVDRPEIDRVIAERYYGERGELARNIDRLKEAVRGGEEPEAALARLQAEEPSLAGVTFDRYKGKGKAGQQPWDIKLSETGAPKLKAAPDSSFERFKSAEQTNEDIARAIRNLRDPKVTTGDTVDVISALIGDEYMVLSVLDLPANYDGASVVSNRTRQRAIRLLQMRRANTQQEFLRRIEEERGAAASH
jgi:hypothetical protein